MTLVVVVFQSYSWEPLQEHRTSQRLPQARSDGSRDYAVGEAIDGWQNVTVVVVVVVNFSIGY